MKQPTSFFLVLSTIDQKTTATRLARTLVEERLAACVNVVPGIESHYFWEEKLCRSREWLLLIKTHAKKLKALELRLQELHSYDCPEIVAIPLTPRNPAYRKWLESGLGLQLR